MLKKNVFEGFSKLAPLSVPMNQYLVEFVDENAKNNANVYGTLTLPYTIPGTPDFAAIHSNPPGIHTDISAVFSCNAEKGQIFYVAAPIEMSKPYMSRQVVARIMDMLVGERSYQSNAPKMVETLAWEKGDSLYFALLNEQEEAPFIPIHDITISVKGCYSQAIDLRTMEKLPLVKNGEMVSVNVERLENFDMIQLTN